MAPPLCDPLNYRPPSLLRRPEALGEGRATSWPTPAATAKAFTLKGDRDSQARLKVELIRSKVIGPALGPGPRGLAFTRGLLAQALNRAPLAVNGHAKAKEAGWIFEWVRSRLRYVNDPSRAELFQQLPELFGQGIGDCDDYTAALAALLKAAGFRVQARLIELKPGRGWAHIYPRVWIPAHVLKREGGRPVPIPGRWVPLDATENHPAGWEAKHTRAMDLEL